MSEDNFSLKGVVVGRKWDKGAIYIGRPSPLGNPFFMKDEGYRDRVVEQYREWLYEQIASGNTSVVNELKRLCRLYHEKGELVLGCFCSPRRCHGDVIKEIIEGGFLN